LALALACAVDERALAVVGKGKVDAETFKERLAAATGEPWEAANDAVASRLFDQLLDQEVVLVAAGRDGGVETHADPSERMAQMRRLLDELCGPPPSLDPAVVEAEVAKVLDVDRPARANVRQMLLDSREEAGAARRQLDEGADFVELSRSVSRAPNAAGGGDLGMLTQGGLSDDLDEVIFALAAGEISEPVPGPSGYHIFQVLEVFPAGAPTREEVEPDVRRRLGEVAAREHSAACVRRLAGEVGVRVIHDRLWFAYEGRYAEVIHES